MFLGDCSLVITSVSLSIDEGEWQCGVTSSNVTLQDSLVSSPVWLAVMGEYKEGGRESSE